VGEYFQDAPDLPTQLSNPVPSGEICLHVFFPFVFKYLNWSAEFPPHPGDVQSGAGRVVPVACDTPCDVAISGELQQSPIFGRFLSWHNC